MRVWFRILYVGTYFLTPPFCIFKSMLCITLCTRDRRGEVVWWGVLETNSWRWWAINPESKIQKSAMGSPWPCRLSCEQRNKLCKQLLIYFILKTSSRNVHFISPKSQIIRFEVLLLFFFFLNILSSSVRTLSGYETANIHTRIKFIT